MQLVKSLHGGILYKAFQYQGENILCVSALWGFRLTDGHPVIEPKMWAAIADSADVPFMMDKAMPKEHAEFLVQGAFHAPRGEPVRGGQARVRVGSREKTINVYGDRHWVTTAGIGLTPSTPAPFTRMPISYQLAFGGEGFERNPSGKGFRVELDEDGLERQPLPNLEYPNALIGAPKDKPAPASLGGIDVMWQPRMGRSGTYDDKYIRERMPGFPDDIDWRYFNDAAEDQWLPGLFQGDELIEVHHMHPEIAHISGRLPGVRSRIFALRTDPETDEAEFRELSGKRDTLWLFPEQNLGVIFERGTIRCHDPEAEDITGVMTAHEWINDQPRSKDYYWDQYQKRTHPDERHLYLMNTQPLLPPGVGCALQEIIDDSGMAVELAAIDLTDKYREEKDKEIEAQKAEAEKTLREQAESLGEAEVAKLEARLNAKPEDNPIIARVQAVVEKIAPGISADPKNIDLTKLNLKAMEELAELGEQIKQEEMAKARQQLIDAIAQLRGKGEESDRAADKLEDVLRQLDLPPILPRVDLEAVMKQMNEAVQQAQAEADRLRSLGATEEQIERLHLGVDEIQSSAKETQDKLINGYREGAHYIESARSPHAGEEPAIVERLDKTIAAGESAGFGDYAFCDLRDREFRNVDFSNALMEFTRLENSRFINCDLSGAVLVHCDMRNTRFEACDLRHANLGSSKLHGTRISHCQCDGAKLARAQLDGVHMQACDFINCTDGLLETRFANSRFEDCDFHGNAMNLPELENCSFLRCDLNATHWIKGRFERCEFIECQIGETNFIESVFTQAVFDRSVMPNVRFVGGCSLTSASFAGAQFDKANLMLCDLHSARFNGARFDEAIFNYSDLREADFSGARGRRSMLNSVDLQNARLGKADFFEGSFYKAKLMGADLSDSNLYGSNLMQVSLGETRFGGANLDQTILKDWRPLT